MPDLGVRLDLHPVFPVSSPQATYFGPGVAGRASVMLQPMPLLDVEAQLGALMLTQRTEGGLGRGASAFTAGLGVRLKRPMEGNLVSPFFEVGGGLALTGGAKFEVAPAAGVMFRWNEELPFWLGLSARFHQIFKMGDVPDFNSFDASLFAIGLSLEFAGGSVTKDRDGDGVSDDQDACPDEAGKGADGCAAAPPPPLVESDRDGDGVPDTRDACPNESGTGANGCPDADPDHDGLAGAKDECPNDAGPASANGCPDRDGDGVPDKKDPCPKVAGPKENGGCPTYKEVVVTETKIEIKQKVFFAFGATTILPKSEPLLNEVTQALADRSGICVRVEGHTDSKGNADTNMQLSHGRANAVKDYLVAHGIGPERLRGKGYGATLPRDENSTAEGRDNNRRVEFVIISCKESESP